MPAVLSGPVLPTTLAPHLTAFVCPFFSGSQGSQESLQVLFLRLFQNGVHSERTTPPAPASGTASGLGSGIIDCRAIVVVLIIGLATLYICMNPQISRPQYQVGLILNCGCPRIASSGHFVTLTRHRAPRAIFRSPLQEAYENRSKRERAMDRAMDRSRCEDEWGMQNDGLASTVTYCISTDIISGTSQISGDARNMGIAIMISTCHEVCARRPESVSLYK